MTETCPTRVTLTPSARDLATASVHGISQCDLASSLTMDSATLVGLRPHAAKHMLRRNVTNRLGAIG
jgi:hypothetical protein